MTRRTPPTGLFEGQTPPWSRVHNIGLAYQKLVPLNSEQRRDGLSSMIRAIADRPEPPVYGAAFERWRAHTSPTAEHRVVRVVESQGRVLAGLGERTPSENGLSLHAVYGTPILPGSSLKGVARAWCSRTLSGEPGWEADGEFMLALFGSATEDGAVAGGVDFLDALWVPDGRWGPWACEILTPHHGRYYQGKADPDGMDDPIPVSFLAAQGRFRLVIEGPGDWAALAMQVLLRALAEDGVGAKTRVGYGRLQESDDLLADGRDHEAWERAHQEWRDRAFRTGIESVAQTERLPKLVAHLPQDGEWERNLILQLKGKQVEQAEWIALLDWADEVVLEQVLQHLFDRKQTGGLRKPLSQVADEVRATLLVEIFDRVIHGGAGADSTEDASKSPASGSHYGDETYDVEALRERYSKAGKPKRQQKLRSDAVKMVSKGRFTKETVTALLAFLKETQAPDGQVRQLCAPYGLPTE